MLENAKHLKKTNSARISMWNMNSDCKVTKTKWGNRDVDKTAQILGLNKAILSMMIGVLTGNYGLQANTELEAMENVG